MSIPKLTILAIVSVFSATTLSYAVEPIRGSINYNDPDKPCFAKIPPGTLVYHDFVGEDGTNYNESYRVQDNGSVKLLNRRAVHRNDS